MRSLILVLAGDFGVVGPASASVSVPVPSSGIPSGSQHRTRAIPYAPPLVIQPEPGVSVQQAASPAITYWYYCAKTNGYYPSVQECPGGWREVPTTPMG